MRIFSQLYRVLDWTHVEGVLHYWFDCSSRFLSLLYYHYWAWTISSLIICRCSYSGRDLHYWQNQRYWWTNYCAHMPAWSVSRQWLLTFWHYLPGVFCSYLVIFYCRFITNQHFRDWLRVPKRFCRRRCCTFPFIWRIIGSWSWCRWWGLGFGFIWVECFMLGSCFFEWCVRVDVIWLIVIAFFMIVTVFFLIVIVFFVIVIRFYLKAIGI